jgi:hypothetical protein
MRIHGKYKIELGWRGSSLICKEGCRFSMGWCMREPYCPLSSAVCNATIPTLPLFEMAITIILSAALPDEEKVDEVVRVVKSALPRQNYIVLKYLMEFLVQVSMVL